MAPSGQGSCRTPNRGHAGAAGRRIDLGCWRTAAVTSRLRTTMLAPVIQKDALSDEGPVRLSAVEERDFYGHYGWCLNPHLTVAEAQTHLGEELEKLGILTIDWQRREAAVNVYLLACGILNTADEYLRGKTFRLPNLIGRWRAVRGIQTATEWVGTVRRWRTRMHVRRWRDASFSALDRKSTRL